MPTTRNFFGARWVTYIIVCLQSVERLAIVMLITSSTVVRDLGIFVDSDSFMYGGWVRGASGFCFSCSVFAGVFQKLVVCLTFSRLDYCNSVLVGLPVNLINCLRSVYYDAARLI